MRWWEAISDSGYYRRYHLKTINTFPKILSGYSLSINHPRLLRDPPARTHKLYRVGTESNFLGQFPKGSLEQIIPGARKYLFCCRAECISLFSVLTMTISHPGPGHLLRQLSQNYRSGRYQSILAREDRTTPPDSESARREKRRPLTSEIVSKHPSPDCNYNNGVRVQLLCHCQRLPL